MTLRDTDGNNVVRIHAGKQPRRPHFLEEWAKKYGLKTQVELAEALGADKSIVSRWFNGASPSVEYQLKLAALFQIEDGPEALFRHPDDDWLAKFFKGRSQEERERIKQTLEVAFPRAANSSGK